MKLFNSVKNRFVCGFLALYVGFSSAQGGNYVGAGLPPPDLLPGEITIKNSGDVEIVFALTSSVCAQTLLHIPPNTTSKVSCIGADTFTATLNSKLASGEVRTRIVNLPTRTHYFIADDGTALTIATGTPALK